MAKPISRKRNTPTLYIYASITLSAFPYSYWSQSATVQSTVQENTGSDSQMKICDNEKKKKYYNFMIIKKQRMFTDVYQSFDNTSKEYTTTTLISGAG